MFSLWWYIQDRLSKIIDCLSVVLLLHVIRVIFSKCTRPTLTIMVPHGEQWESVVLRALVLQNFLKSVHPSFLNDFKLSNESHWNNVSLENIDGGSSLCWSWFGKLFDYGRSIIMTHISQVTHNHSVFLALF
jgi:hypothetical protein